MPFNFTEWFKLGILNGSKDRRGYSIYKDPTSLIIACICIDNTLAWCSTVLSSITRLLLFIFWSSALLGALLKLELSVRLPAEFVIPTSVLALGGGNGFLALLVPPPPGADTELPSIAVAVDKWFIGRRWRNPAEDNDDENKKLPLSSACFSVWWCASIDAASSIMFWQPMKKYGRSQLCGSTTFNCTIYITNGVKQF